MSPTPLAGATGPAPPAPRSVGQLTRVLLAWVREHGQAEKRTRDWISGMAVAAMLERTGDGGRNALFIMKGGMALEMRLGGRARATRDIDFSYRGPQTDDLVQVIEEALSIPYGSFTFQRTGKPLDMSRVNTVRVEVKVRFNGSDWGTVILDVNRGEDAPIDVEMVEAFDIRQAFGLEGPEWLPCLSLHDHMAQKIHGMTQPATHDASPNERVQDAIDVLLFRDGFVDAAARTRLRRACEATFTARATHAWPPIFAPPELWRGQFAAMAAEVGLEVRSLDDATRELRAFVRDVAGAPQG